MPKKVANERFFSESPPRAFAIAWRDTTAWTMPDSVKPRIRGQRISQSMLTAMKRALRRSFKIVTRFPFAPGPIPYGYGFYMEYCKAAERCLSSAGNVTRDDARYGLYALHEWLSGGQASDGPGVSVR